MLDLQRPYSMPHATTFEPLEPTVPNHRPSWQTTSHNMNAASIRPLQYWADGRSAESGDGYRGYQSNNLAGGYTPSDWAFDHSSRSTSATNTSKTSAQVHNVDVPASEQEELQSPTADAALPTDLKVPSNVKTPQISIAQLAAEVTCLFWFENGNTLKQIENATTTPTTPINFVPDARPTPNFKKWISSLLATTQVKPNVVLLALLFIYRLKCANPGVKGKPGSEYRLLTVALMLGNKFLDDNTYTNKTWADVSAISAQEVHIMEVEFLSNMRYTLYVSDVQWKNWNVSLGKFGTYVSNCLRHWDQMSMRAAQLNSLAGMHGIGLLPSPPASGNGSPQVVAHSPSNLGRQPLLLNSQLSTHGSAPAPAAAYKGRKRSYDEAVQEPVAKRHTSMYPMQLPQPSTTASTQHMTQTTMAPLHQAPLYATSSMPMNVAHQLPPLGTRAMATVYPKMQHPTSQPISMPPLQTNILPQPGMNRLDPSRGLSPFTLESAASSPLSGPLSQHTGVTTPYTRLSPSFYLAQRSSPYKPVRRPYTLLAPPPPIAYHNPARQVSDDQMQYHCLGRPMGEIRHGHIPYNPQPQHYYSPLPPLSVGSASRQ